MCVCEWSVHRSDLHIDISENSDSMRIFIPKFNYCYNHSMCICVCVHGNTFVCVFNYVTQSRSFFIFVFLHACVWVHGGEGWECEGRGETILKDVEVK